jgi:hypothetical protein
MRPTCGTADRVVSIPLSIHRLRRALRVNAWNNKRMQIRTFRDENDLATHEQKMEKNMNISALARKLALGAFAISSFLIGVAEAHAATQTVQKPNAPSSY